MANQIHKIEASTSKENVGVVTIDIDFEKKTTTLVLDWGDAEMKNTHESEVFEMMEQAVDYSIGLVNRQKDQA